MTGFKRWAEGIGHNLVSDALKAVMILIVGGSAGVVTFLTSWNVSPILIFVLSAGIIIAGVAVLERIRRMDPDHFPVPGIDRHEEDRRIRDFRCVHHVQLFRLTVNMDNSVTVRVSTWRLIKNVSQKTSPLAICPAIDENQVPHHPTTIHSLSARVGKDSWRRLDKTNISTEPHIYKARGETVHVPAGEAVDTEFDFQETRGLQDEERANFVVGTRAPLLLTDVDDRLTWSITFEHHPGQASVITSPGGAVRLAGILGTDQAIRLQWHPKAQQSR